MAQNFWIAIVAFTSCFLVTVLVSMVTRVRKESELEGLVYGLTKIPMTRTPGGSSVRLCWRFSFWL